MEYPCCGSEFFIHIVVIILLVLFAGLMSGLTLGLMSLSLVDLEVLAKSGTPKDKLHAGIVFLCSEFQVVCAIFILWILLYFIRVFLRTDENFLEF